MKHYWYTDVTVYGIDVKVFRDSNGDGFGDFPGLTSKLDYLTDLGINCVWLLPFFPSPLRDNGYDVADFFNVDPRLGTLDDFKAFIKEAKKRNIRVLIDFVANHTSIDHPWFQEARRDKNSKYRDYYVWADAPPEDVEPVLVFPGIEDSNWAYDEEAGAYYFHYFYSHQADLNYETPAVRNEVEKALKFWLDLGVDGFRIDAAPFLISRKGESDPLKDPHHKRLREMRAFAESINPDVVLLGEANLEPEYLDEFFGDPDHADEMNMLFDFRLNCYLFLVLAREEAADLHDFLEILPHTPENGQWLNFLRNHDEIDLSRLTKAEQKDIFAAFGPAPEMQAYGRGIRRRIAPMLGNDRRRLELAFCLLFSMPGTPLFMWGDEIGMGDDLSLKERESVRTPMQWSDEPNAGFSTASAEKLFRPVIEELEFGYTNVNVEKQRADKDSFWHWMRKLIDCTHEAEELNHGDIKLIKADESSILIHAATWKNHTTIAIHNLSPKPCTAHADFDGYDLSEFEIMFGDRDYEKPENAKIKLNGYGYCWLRRSKK